ncbi:MAG: hypothetical protein Q8L52_01045 [bacterium]|nr:hypothetical protein [bacterium]
MDIVLIEESVTAIEEVRKITSGRVVLVCGAGLEISRGAFLSLSEKLQEIGLVLALEKREAPPKIALMDVAKMLSVEKLAARAWKAGDWKDQKSYDRITAGRIRQYRNRAKRRFMFRSRGGKM